MKSRRTNWLRHHDQQTLSQVARYYKLKYGPGSMPDRRLSLTDMQRLFDETPEGNMERRWAIADCMRLPLSQAIKESEIRIEEADHRDT